MTIFVGKSAIDYAAKRGLTLNKYADPTEDARAGLSIEQATDIAAEDPSLIWIETRIDWVERYPDQMPTADEFVAISDGTTTVCAITDGRPLAHMIADYVRTYSFNSPGVVRASAGLFGVGSCATQESFTICSVDGEYGKLVEG